jgi:hypothetical protein
MVKKYTLTLDKEFIQYCELNNIEDIEKLAKETFDKGFNLLKYGDTPYTKIVNWETKKIYDHKTYVITE